MGKEIARLGLEFDLVLASPARRVSETIDFLQIGLGRSLPVRLQDNLYTASADDLFEIAARIPRRIERLLIVGHNPALQQFAVDVSNPDAQEVLHRLKDHFPTAAFVHLALSMPRWNELRTSNATPRLYIKPKELLQPDL